MSQTEWLPPSFLATTRAYLPNWLKLERIERVGPALNTLRIIHTLKRGAVTRPKRTLRPLTKLLNLTSIIARADRRIQPARLNTVLNPVNDGRHVILWVGTGLQTVATAVRRAWDQVELVPFVHSLQSFGVCQVRVHGRADGLPVVH